MIRYHNKDKNMPFQKYNNRWQPNWILIKTQSYFDLWTVYLPSLKFELLYFIELCRKAKFAQIAENDDNRKLF